MIPVQRRIFVCRVLILLTLCFIWGNSLLPAEVSQALSDSVQELLVPLRTVQPETGSGSAGLRKLAHFAEFTVLGMLLTWLAVLQQKKQVRALAFGAAAACIDEAIQFFSPGRSPGLTDVAIDCFGVLAGMILLQLGHLCIVSIYTKQYGGK